ncbi:MAG TPA: hypothetical protein VMV54_09555 [Acidocella sp.]|nr:hypothetical protein [Acidocella sp.]
MANINRLEKRVTALQQEKETLQAAIADLERERGAKHEALQGLWAAAERTPTDESTRAADHAEKEHDNLGRQLERKQAAVEACAVELAEAQAELGQAERGAVVTELRDLIDQVRAAAERVDADITDAEAWGELHGLVQRVNQLYWLQLGSKGYGEFRAIFADPPAKLRGKVYAWHARRCDAAMDDHMTVDVPVARMVDLLNVEQAQARVRSLQP